MNLINRSGNDNVLNDLQLIMNQMNDQKVNVRKRGMEQLEQLLITLAKDFELENISLSEWDLFIEYYIVQLEKQMEKSYNWNTAQIVYLAEKFRRLFFILVPNVEPKEFKSFTNLISINHFVSTNSIQKILNFVVDKLSLDEGISSPISINFMLILKRCILIPEYTYLISESLLKKYLTIFLTSVIREELNIELRINAALCLYYFLETYPWDLSAKVCNGILRNMQRALLQLTPSTLRVILPILKAMNTFIDKRILYMVTTFRMMFHDLTSYFCTLWNASSSMISIRIELCNLFNFALQTKMHIEEVPLDINQLGMLNIEFQRTLNSPIFLGHSMNDDNGSDSVYNSLIWQVAAEVIYYIWRLENETFTSHSERKRQKKVNTIQSVYDSILLDRYPENWLMVLQNILTHHEDFEIDEAFTEQLVLLLNSETHSTLTKELILRIISSVELNEEQFHILWGFSQRSLASESHNFIESCFLAITSKMNLLKNSNLPLSELIKVDSFTSNPSQAIGILESLVRISHTPLFKRLDGFRNSLRMWIISLLTTPNNLSCELLNLSALLLSSLYLTQPSKFEKKIEDVHEEVINSNELVYDPFRVVKNASKRKVTPISNNSTSQDDISPFLFRDEETFIRSMENIVFPPFQSENETKRSPTKVISWSELGYYQYSINMLVFISNLSMCLLDEKIPFTIIATLHQVLSRSLSYLVTTLEKNVDNYGFINQALPQLRKLFKDLESVSTRISPIFLNIKLPLVSITNCVLRNRNARDNKIHFDFDEIPTSKYQKAFWRNIEDILEIYSTFCNLTIETSSFRDILRLFNEEGLNENIAFMMRVAEVLIDVKYFEDAERLLYRFESPLIKEMQISITRKFINFSTNGDIDNIITHVKDWIQQSVDGSIPEAQRLLICKLLINSFERDKLQSCFESFFHFIHDPSYVIRLEAISYISKLITKYEKSSIVFNDIISDIKDASSWDSIDDLGKRSYLVALTQFACISQLQRDAVLKLVEARTTLRGMSPDFFLYINRYLRDQLGFVGIQDIYAKYIEDIIYYATTDENSVLDISSIPLQLFGESCNLNSFYVPLLNRILPILVTYKKSDDIERIASILDLKVDDIIVNCFSAIYAYTYLTGDDATLKTLMQHNSMEKQLQGQRDEVIAFMIYFSRNVPTSTFFLKDKSKQSITTFCKSFGFQSFEDFLYNQLSSFYCISTMLLELGFYNGIFHSEFIVTGLNLLIHAISTQMAKHPFVIRTVLHFITTSIFNTREDSYLLPTLLTEFFSKVSSLGSSVNGIAKEINKLLVYSTSEPNNQMKDSIRDSISNILKKYESEIAFSAFLTIPPHMQFKQLISKRQNHFSQYEFLKECILNFVEDDNIASLAFFLDYFVDIKKIMTNHEQLFRKFIKKLTRILKGQFDIHTKKFASTLLGNLGLSVYSQIDENATFDSDEFEFFDPPISSSDHKLKTLITFYNSKILILLSKCLENQNLAIVKIAVRTIHALLSTKEGEEALYIIDDDIKLLLEPFFVGPKVKFEDCISPKHTDMQQLFSTLANESTEHDSWVKELGHMLLQKGYIISPFLYTCKDIAIHDIQIAEIVWILGLFDIVIVQEDDEYIEEFENLLNKYVISNHLAPLKSTRLVIFSIRLLLKMRKFQFAKKVVPSTSKPDYVLKIPPISLARASLRAGAPLSALQFVEMHMEVDRVLQPLSNQNVIFEKDLKVEETMLLEIYTNLGEPDSIYGLPEVYGAKGQVLRSEHEERWSDSLSFYDSLLNDESIPQNYRYDLQGKLLSSLQNVGYEYILSTISNYIFRNDFSDLSIALQNKLIEVSWRSGNFDLDIDSSGYQYFILQSLQTLRNKDYRTTFEFLDRAEVLVQSTISYNLLPSLVRYHMISDIRLVAGRLNSSSETQNILEELMNISHLQLQSFTTVEPLLALRSVLIHMLNQGESMIEYYCSVAALARRKGMLDYATNMIRSLSVKYQEFDICPKWIYEEAKLLWKKGNKSKATSVMKFFINVLQSYSDSSELIGQSVKHLAKWYGSTLSESVENIRALMENAFAMCNDTSSVYYSFGKFEDSLFKACERKLRSEENVLFEKLMEENKKLLQEYKLTISKQKSPDIQKAYRNLKRTSDQDQRKKDDLAQRTKQYLCNALNNYGKSAIHGNSHSLEAVFRFVSLWLKIPMDPDVNKCFWKCFLKISPHKFVPLVYQIASRLGSTRISKEFNAVVQHTLLKIAAHSPYHSLYQLFALKNGNYKETSEVFKVDDERIKDAMTVISQLRKSPNLRTIIDQMDQLITAYVNLAYYEIPENQKGLKQIPIPSNQLIQKMSQLDSIHVPTKELPILVDGDYQSSITSIKSFSPTFSTAGGVNLPKIITCIGSDDQAYRQLVKNRDDLRQDAVMQQLFDVVNQLLQHHPETQKRHLRIRGYKVIPLSPRSGVLGWVENTLPLAEYLVGSNATSSISAHSRYRPNDYAHGDCRKMIGQAATLSYEERVNVFQKVCENFKPVFHHFFTEKFPDSSKWFSKRLSFTRSVAASSIVGYIIGLGDRHAQNILLDLESAEVCHIDLGVAFDQGQLLPIPETVPFRLTRDIVDGFGVTGCEGVFRRCCISTMKILRQNIDLLYTIVEVLLHDPLYNWSIDLGKRVRMQQEVLTHPLSTTVDVKNRDAGRVLIRFTEKLQGYEDNELLGVEGHVNKLILQARSVENLATLFHGWCAHV